MSGYVPSHAPKGGDAAPRPLWMRASAFACRAHQGETRKDGKTPFVSHVFRVAMVTRDLFGCDDELALAIALLHDAIEDTPCDFEDIEKEFGEEVARGVAALTKDMRIPESEREPAYDKAVAAGGWRVHIVKLADAYDNYCDRKDLGRNLKKRRRTCERAIACAAGSMDRPEVARGVAMVQRLIDEERVGQESGVRPGKAPDVVAGASDKSK